MNPEQATIRAFIVPARQGLYLALLSDRNGRARLAGRLRGGKDLDPRCLVPIDPDEQTAAGIAAALKKLGAPTSAQTISGNPSLDRRPLPLEEALEQTVSKGSAAIVSCVPGRLAYFEDAEDGRRFILRRSGRSPKKAR